MALAKCRECGNTVSTEAQACPHCGAPRPVTVTAPPLIPRQPSPVHVPAKKKSRGILSSCLLVICISVGAFILLCVILALVDSGPKKNAEPTFDQKSEEARSIRREQQRQLEVSNVVAQLNGATLSSDERVAKIKKLLALDPNTKEFPSEVAAVREEIDKNRRYANEFLITARGNKVPADKWPEYGTPETLPATDTKYWVAYLPRLDVSFVARKDSDIVTFAAQGMDAASKHLEEQKAARKKQIEQAFSPWDGSHNGLEKVIKQSMNDPKSYDHDKTVYADMGDYLIVTTTFRGKNAFGGVVKNTCRAKCDLDGNVIEVLHSGP
jgi:hypothetical protein